jgi:hypothetical protein
MELCVHHPVSIAQKPADFFSTQEADGILSTRKVVVLEPEEWAWGCVNPLG